MEVRGKEEAARNQISSQYARDHQYQTVGQVLVNGKLFAEVNDAGGYASVKNSIPGLSDAALNPQERLEEIAQALKGQGKVEIRYANFEPALVAREALERRNPCSHPLRRETSMTSSRKPLKRPGVCVPRHCKRQSPRLRRSGCNARPKARSKRQLQGVNTDMNSRHYPARDMKPGHPASWAILLR